MEKFDSEQQMRGTLEPRTSGQNQVSDPQQRKVMRLLRQTVAAGGKQCCAKDPAEPNRRTYHQEIIWRSISGTIVNNFP